VAALAAKRYLGGLLAAVLVLSGVVAGVVFAQADRAQGADTAEAHTNGLAFVVHRTETTDVIADPEFPTDNVAADGRFVVVKLSVTNTSADGQVFHSAFSTLSDGAVQYRVDEAARHYVGDADRVLAPGESIDAALVFDVPRGVDPQSIVLRERPSSPGVSIAL
jgi:hypothetical protein